MLKSSYNTDAKAPIIVENAEDKINIGHKERVTEIIIDEIFLLTIHDFKKTTSTEALDLVIDFLEIEAQLAALKKRRKKSTPSIKTKKIARKKV